MLFIAFLIIENIQYSQRINEIAIRITVTGTRGKTSIVRALASILRTKGMRVLAKTTGSEAKYILPNGEEINIIRKGLTSILEQKKLIKKASKLNVDCLITEIMSIQAENHIIETNKLIKPNISIFSNFRPDHIDAAGVSKDAISELYVNDIFPGSKVFINENDINDIFLNSINSNNCQLHKISESDYSGIHLKERSNINHFSNNVMLVSELSKNLGLDKNTIHEGILNTKLDIGKLEIYKLVTNNKEIYFVNSFAANDPESTYQQIIKTISILNLKKNKIVGIMPLRIDRGERSKQWMEYLIKNPGIFNHVYFYGLHSAVLERKIKNSEIINKKDPDFITNYIISRSENNSIIFGLANIKGLGITLIKHWNNTGEIINN